MSDNERLTKRIDVRVDEELAQRVADAAEREDRSEGAYVRRVLRRHFRELDDASVRTEQVA